MTEEELMNAALADMGLDHIPSVSITTNNDGLELTTRLDANEVVEEALDDVERDFNIDDVDFVEDDEDTINDLTTTMEQLTASSLNTSTSSYIQINDGLLAQMSRHNEVAGEESITLAAIEHALAQEIEDFTSAAYSLRAEEETTNINQMEQQTEDTEINDIINQLLIPENDKSLSMNNTRTLRFSGATWFEEAQKHSIIIGGMGGISSWAFEILTRIRPRQIYIYDDDVVEHVNMAGQFFMKDSLGKKKVDAASQIANDFSDYHSTMAISEKFTLDTAGGPIMICGFDNMVARKSFFNVWLKYVNDHRDIASKCLFIDGRLSIDQLQVFCITGDNTYAIQKYNNTYLFKDEQAEATTCSMKQTTYAAAMIGSIINNLYINFCANQVIEDINDLPFKVVYDTNCMLFKTSNE